MGAYGSTSEASMSLSDVGNIADCSNDGLADAEDLLRLMEKWLADDMLVAEDINRDGKVDFSGYANLTQNWLWEE